MIDIGISRHVLVVTADDDDQPPGDVNVDVTIVDEDDDKGFLGEFVLYTLSAARLESLLALAAAGHPVADLMVSVDAAALATSQGLDGDGPEDPAR